MCDIYLFIEILLPFDVLQFTTPNHPPFSLPSRVSTIKPHSMTAQNIRDSSGPNHFDSRNFCTATELPNDLMLLLLFVLLLVKWWFDVHHLIWPMTVLARLRGFWSICRFIVLYCILLLKSSIIFNLRAEHSVRLLGWFFCSLHAIIGSSQSFVIHTVYYLNNPVHMLFCSFLWIECSWIIYFGIKIDFKRTADIRP